MITKDTPKVFDGRENYLCFNRKYRSVGYLSMIQLCSGCHHEVRDLFTGTNGLEVWCWYCNVI